MIHALINALALAPAAATTGPSQHIQDLNAILNQVEKFYGQGWHSLSMENAAIFAVAAAVITVIGVVVGALVPILINGRAEDRMDREIVRARDEMNKNISEVEEKLTKYINTKTDDAVKLLNGDIKAKLKNAKHFAVGSIFAMYAIDYHAEFERNPSNRDKLLSALKFMFVATYKYSLADEPRKADTSKGNTIQYISEINQEEAQTLQSTIKSEIPDGPIPEQFETHYADVLAAIQKKAE